MAAFEKSGDAALFAVKATIDEKKGNRVRIICRLGTAVRFAAVCFALGAVLGFLLSSAWHRQQLAGPSVAAPPGHVRVGLFADQVFHGGTHGPQVADRVRVRLHGTAPATEV